MKIEYTTKYVWLLTFENTVTTDNALCKWQANNMKVYIQCKQYNSLVTKSYPLNSIWQ